MAEYINREATIKRIKEVYCVGCNSYHGVRCRACGTGDAIDIIEDAPSAERRMTMAEYFAGGHLRFVNGEWRDDNGNAIEISRVRHGRWIKESDGGTRCSVCNKRVRDVTGGWYEPVDLSDMPYYPKCGAKMDGGDDGEAD